MWGSGDGGLLGQRRTEGKGETEGAGSWGEGLGQFGSRIQAQTPTWKLVLLPRLLAYAYVVSQAPAHASTRAHPKRMLYQPNHTTPHAGAHSKHHKKSLLPRQFDID